MMHDAMKMISKIIEATPPPEQIACRSLVIEHNWVWDLFLHHLEYASNYSCYFYSVKAAV